MPRSKRRKKSLQRRVNLNTAKQQVDIIKPTGESYLANQLLSNHKLVNSEVERQFRNRAYLDVQYCSDSERLTLKYRQLESPDEINDICDYTKYGDILVNAFRVKYGLEEVAINELDAIPFAELIIYLCELMNQEVWAFLIFYAIQMIRKMKESTQNEAMRIILLNTYEETTSVVSKMKAV